MLSIAIEVLGEGDGRSNQCIRTPAAAPASVQVVKRKNEGPERKDIKGEEKNSELAKNGAGVERKRNTLRRSPTDALRKRVGDERWEKKGRQQQKHLGKKKEKGRPIAPICHPVKPHGGRNAESVA